MVHSQSGHSEYQTILRHYDKSTEWISGGCFCDHQPESWCRKEKKRALKAFWCVLVMNLILSVILMSASLLCLHQIADLFANGDHEFAGRIMEIYRMEALGTIPLGASAAVMAFLYGYGKTKLTLLLNFSRVFVFRIPVLWGLQAFHRSRQRERRHCDGSQQYYDRGDVFGYFCD